MRFPELLRTRLRVEEAITKPKERFLDEEMPQHAGVSHPPGGCGTEQDADPELAHPAVLHGDSVMAVIDDPAVADLGVGIAAGSLGPVAVDRCGRSDRG